MDQRWEMKESWTELEIWKDSTYTAADTGRYQADQSESRGQFAAQQSLAERLEPLEAVQSRVS